MASSSSNQKEQGLEVWRSDTSLPYPPDKTQYRLQKQLSHGPTTIVFKALCIPLQTTVAIKIINLGNLEKHPELFAAAVFSAYPSLPNHPAILKPYLIYIFENKLNVVMPYMRAGSLQSLISHKFRNGLRPERIAAHMLTILIALAEMHSIGMVHLGVKPGNILLTDSGTAVLSDFAVSSWNYDKEFWSEESHGSLSWWKNPLYWLPPEAFSAAATKLCYQSDVWSVGITALELYYGRPPITKFPNSAAALCKISKRFQYADHLSKDRPVGKQCPPTFKSFLSACLQGPFKRPIAVQIVEHEFVKRAAKTSNYTKKLKLQKGMPDIDERFNVLVRKTLTIDEPVVRHIPRRLISSWEFNSETLILDPVYCMNITDIDDQVRANAAIMSSDNKTLDDEIEEFRLGLESFILDTILEEVLKTYRSCMGNQYYFDKF